MGKPIDEKDAERILHLLNNRTHEVITAYCIYAPNIFIEHHVISYVTFNNLSDEFIKEYIKTGSPMDKAGAYGIQDEDNFPIVKSYQGSLNNIIGFPSEEIKEDLKKEGLLR